MTTILKDVGFVHLHVHSSYSLLEGALPIAKLAELAKADGQPALALTDTNNLFGALEFSEKLAGYGLQPIVGIQLCVDFGDRPNARGRTGALPESRGSIVLLAANEAGYHNLMGLSSRAFLDTPTSEDVHLPLEGFAGRSAGIIALTGGPGGPIDRALSSGLSDVARTRMEKLAALFPRRLYVELQRHGLEEERRIEPALIGLADDLGLPLVAAAEAFFGKREDYEAHDALLCIAEGRVVADDERRRLSPQHGFMTRAEMRALFADLPDALANSVEIAMRCSYRPKKRNPILPRFVAGADDAAEAAALRRMAEEGLERRLATIGAAPGLDAETYRQRLDFELNVIDRMKYPGYFLIVADFIQWAKKQGVPVGPGRGSGAGSLVAYALTITDLDPLRFGLLFERFLNPDRVSMPDFDIDFCQDRRDEVIAYVRERYGNDRVAQIITFGTLLARGVMRDVGRVLGLSYTQVDRLTKLVPQVPAKPVTLAEAVRDEAQLRAAAAENEGVARMLEIAQKLEGLYRHASTHAAGIVIGDRPLHELVPLYRDPKSDMPVTQFNMKWVEPAGLVKFDFLGLKTLTVLQGAVELLARRGVTVDLSAIPLDDPGTYALLSRADTVGVFQVESPGMRRALIDMKPDRLEDIIALVALYRPGPMANIPVYCEVKHGLREPDYHHPRLEPILKETYGVIVYQEQVMQIAQVLSGYSLGEADLLRRAMGKKIKAEMDAQRGRFVQGAVERGEKQADADMIFDLLAKFADYGFNKSHAAAYALVSYQTAWLKANHPVEFLAASMSLELTNTDKLAEFQREAARLEIPVDPPDVNTSGVTFEVFEGRIHYALAAIKGVGTEAARALVAARGEKPFASLANFAARVGTRAVNKRTFEQLVCAGAFDRLEKNRARLIAGADHVFAHAASTEHEATSGQARLFGGGSGEEALTLPDAAAWPLTERLKREHAAVGFYLSGHPLDDYADALKRLAVPDYAEFIRSVKGGASFGRLAASVLDRQERRTKTGNKMGIVTLSDRSAQFEATLFAEGLAQFRDVLEPGRVLLLTVSASMEGDEVRCRIQNAEPLDKAASKVQKAIRVFVREDAPVKSIGQRLAKKGEGAVSLVILLDGGEGEVEVRLPGQYDVSPAAVGAMKSIAGVVDVRTV
jgi:DNA polymerase-3 subunit alpha